MASADIRIDTAPVRSLSFAPAEAPYPNPSDPFDERAPVPVGPGRPAHAASTLVTRARRDAVNGYPIQAAKVQRPPLREATLPRDRLLDWLAAKIHHRVVLVLAEAGYGKTTLLADFSRRSRQRTLWYRLDEDDRDGITFLHHLVAAGREHDPQFAPTTASMLMDTGIAGPTRDAVLTAFLRELPAIAEHGAALVLDDFHLVDDAEDVKVIARALVAHAPERLCIAFSSRRPPTIPLARLRAVGEVAELRTDDLRFDAGETTRLFSETYGRALEPDVLADLSARTEGWAASLQLVQTALRDRSPAEIRSFVRTLTGAEHDLYDYLAEEVVGDLPQDLQDFLMRTSILQVVDPELAAIVTDLGPAHIRSLMETAEKLGLLSRRGQATRDTLRAHPLVRDFLEDRLRRDLGSDGVVRSHLRVASFIESQDWRIACHHYGLAGDQAAVERVLDESIERIVAHGEFSTAEAFIQSAATDKELASFHVVLSRADLLRGDTATALTRARRAHWMDPGSAVALANLASVSFAAGDFNLASEAASSLVSMSDDHGLGEIGSAMLALIATSVSANIDDAVRELTTLRIRQSARGHAHYEGITLLNLAVFQKIRRNAPAALKAADESIRLLGLSSRGVELASAHAIRAWALCHMYEAAGAEDDIRLALSSPSLAARAEAALEIADIECWYGDAARASDLLDEVELLGDRIGPHRELLLASKAQLLLRLGEVDEAARLIQEFQVGAPSPASAHMARQLAIKGHLALLREEASARDLIGDALEHSSRQGASLWVEYALLLRAVLEGGQGLSRYVRRTKSVGASSLSMLAELVVANLSKVEVEDVQAIAEEAALRAPRWRPPLRTCIDKREGQLLHAARVLDSIGLTEDVGRLRRVARLHRTTGDGQLGRGLARRLAHRIFIEDQGRVTLTLGPYTINGTDIRRKVLALVCFLLTRPQFSATRDEVLDALWPEAEPAVALNSLNQTVYFLRRILEPEYVEDTSPGYIRHESDVLWLDTELVSSRSQKCLELVHQIREATTPDNVDRLTSTYQGPFALDFAYEDWAANYRDALQAAYLQIMEREIAADIASGQFERGIALARAALQVAPDSDHLELSLLRLYRLTGAHSAAAEQYAHYASVMRNELGVDPPPLEML